MFYLSDKVVVVTGFPYGYCQNCEVINLTNPSEKSTFIANTSECCDSTGAILGDQVLICGGKYYGDFYQTYFFLENPEEKLQVLEKRKWPSSIVLNKSTCWIVGGENLGSTEFISIAQNPVKGPDLPFTVFSHTLVEYNSSSIYIIGGFQDGYISNETWIINPKSAFQMRKGPPLNVERCRHSSGVMKINGKSIIVVAGGAGGNEAGFTVELLDPTSNTGWIIGINSLQGLPALTVIFGRIVTWSWNKV